MHWEANLSRVLVQFYFCQAYNPAEPPKPGEVLSRQNIAFNINECHFSLPTSPQELLQRYQVL